jgi:hypothetical protein
MKWLFRRRIEERARLFSFAGELIDLEVLLQNEEARRGRGEKLAVCKANLLVGVSS